MAVFNERNFKEGNAMERNSLEDMLAEDETVLWRGKPKRSAYIASRVCRMLPVALIWLLFDGGFIGAMIGLGVFKELPPFAVAFICVFFALHLIPVWIWAANVATASRAQKNTEYALTDRRVLLRSGVIGIDVNNLFYTEIKSVNLKVGLTDKWFKVGDIYITANSRAQVISDIENPYQVVTMLQKIVGDIQADIHYPNALRPEENEGYKTKYRG